MTIARPSAGTVTRFLAVAIGLAIACTPPVARAATLTWGTNGGGGSGIWNLSNTGWWDGTTQQAWTNPTPPDNAVFAGTAGTVDIQSNITTGTLTVTTTGYTGTSTNSSTLTVSRIDMSSLGSNGTFNLGVKLTGSGPLSLAGAGDTTFSGGNNANLGINLTNSANDFVGDVTITAGLVAYTADSVFGNAANAIILNGGGLIDPNRSVNLARNIQVQAGGGYIRLWNASTATFGGTISGAGAISRTDWGTLNLSGDLSGYSGTFTQNGNAAMATNLTGSGTVGGNWTQTAGTITFNSASNQTGTGSFSGSFVKSGAGTLTLTNATVGGNWTVNTGGGLAIQNNSAQSMAGAISGAGIVTKLGTGALTLSGASTNTGNWTISSGTLVVNSTNNNTNTTSSALGNMTTANRTITTSTGATLLFQASDAVGAYNNASTQVTLIADGGTITRVAGTTTFNSIGSVTLQNGGRLRTTNGNASTVGSFAVNGTVTVQGTSGSYIDTLSGQTTNSFINLGTTSGSTTFNVGYTGDPTADLTVSAVLADKVLGGTAGLIKTGSGRMVLSGGNTFTGNVTISSGTINVNYTANNQSPTATALGNMTTSGKTVTTSTGATLNFVNSDTMGDFAYKTPVTIIADGGTITRQYAAGQYFNSFGDLMLKNGGRLTSNTGGSTNVQSFSLNGSVTVSGTSGSFIDTVGSSNNGIHLLSNRVGSASSTGTTTFDVAATGDPTADLTVSAPLVNGISYNGASIALATSTLLKAGDGLMRVSSANAYSGGTILRAGSIVAVNANALGTTGTVTINDASTAGNTRLAIDATSGNITIARPITVANQGTGTATLGSASTGGVNQAVFSGAITLQKDVILDGGSAGDRLGFTGGIGGTGNVGVIGTTRVVFSGAANGYAGSTTISATSTLQLSDGTATATSFLPDSQIVVVNGVLNFAKGGNSETIGGLSGSGVVRESQTNSPTLVVDGGQSQVFSGTIANGGGTMAFAKSGAGTQILAGENTYSGATTISGGTLQIGNGGATGSIAAASAVSGSSGAALAFARSDAVTYSGTYGGAGNLAQMGSGTLALTANNTYTGTTSLAAGVLSLGSANAIGTTGTITFGGGTLQYTAANVTDYSSRFGAADSQAFSIDTNGHEVAFGTALSSTGGTLTKLGSGTLTLAANNTYSGATTVSAGVLRLGSGGAAGSVAGAIAVAGGASIVVNRSDAFTLSNTISGSGGIVQAGSGTTTLSGGNSYSGATTITGGVLAVSGASNLGATPGYPTPGNIVIDGGVLSFTNGFALSANRGIALGPSSGSGTGTIDVASGKTLSYAGVIANNGGGTGGLVKTGAGSLALSGTQAYTGATSVNAGTLEVTSGSLASSAVTVASGATLSGAGAVNATTVAASGILQPGTGVAGIGGVGTLSLASLTFGGSATVNLGVSGTAPSSSLQVNGNVTTAGSNTVTFAFGGNLASIYSGTYSLLSYTGAQLSDASAFLVSGSAGARQSVNLANGTQAVNLVIGNAFPIWSGTDGSGWSATDNWILSSTGSSTSFLPNDTVVFDDAGATGTVTLSQDVNPATTTFSGTTLAYTLSSGGGFGITSGGLVKSGPATLTISTSNSFPGGTTLSAGTIRVGNDAALGTGAVTVTGSAAGMTISSDGGTARTLANGLHLDGDVTLGNTTDNGPLTLTGTVTFDNATRTITTPSNVTLSGLVTNGGLTKSGSGILTITGSNDYADGTTLAAGTLRAGNNKALGTGGVTLNAGTLSSDSTTGRTLTNAFTLGGDVTLGDATNTGALTLGAGGISLGGATRQVTTPSNVTFAGAVTSGGLTKLGAGTLTLSAANSYADGTTLLAGTIVMSNVAALGTGTATYAAAGTIQAAVGGTIGNAFAVNSGVSGTFDSAANSITLSGGVANAGTFTLTTTATQTLTGAVSGTGTLVKAGAGRVSLTGTSTSTGDTMISAGTLELGNAGLLGGGSYSGAISNSGTLSIASSAAQTLSGAIANDGTIAVNSSGNQTISGVVSGVGSLTKAGAGTLTLSNASNAYGGGSTITGGTVAFASGALGSSGNVTVNNASLRWAAGNTQDVSPRLVLVNAATATLDTNGNDVTLASGVGAGTSGAVTKAGAGTLTLTASNGYTGLTTVSGGTLQIGAGGSTGSVAGDIFTGATVAFNRSDAYTYSGLMSGVGAVRQVGSGTLTLSGTNTFSGQLTVAQGTLATGTINDAGANGPLGNSANSVVLGSSGATGLLAYTGATASSTKRFTLATGGTGAISVPTATTLTLSGSIDGSGAFVKQGAGTLSLSGSSPFTGNMTITGGTVNVNLTVNTSSPTATSLGDMTANGRAITVNSGATLNFVLADVIGQFNYKTPVTFIADGGTITRSYTSTNYFNSLGDIELRNGGRLTTNDGKLAIVQSFGLNGNVTVSGTSGSFIDTVGTSFNGINLGTTAGSTTFTVNPTGDATADLTVSAPLADKTLGGAASVVKAGAGKMLMTGTSTYTGNTTINGGMFAIGTGGQIYSGAYSGSVLTVGSGATLDLQNWAYGLTTQNLGGLSSNASSMVVSGGTIRISGAGSTSYGRGVTVNSGGATLDATAGATWTIDTVTDSQAWVYNGNPTITLTGGGTGTFDKVLGNGSGGLVKSGTGTWTLTGVNTFSGNTAIDAGVLVLGGAGQFGGGNYGGSIANGGSFVVSTSANQTFSGVVSGAGSLAKSGAGTLTLSNGGNSFTGGVSLTVGILSFANGGVGSSGTVTLGGGTLQWATGNTQDLSSRLALVAATAATLDTNGNDVTLASALGGATSASLVKTGAGALALTASNSFTGGVSVQGGTLQIGNDAALGTGTVSLASGVALSAADTNARTIANAVAVNGDVTLGDGTNAGPLTLSGPVDFGGQTRQFTTPSNVTIAAAVSNANGLAKAGAGTLTLSASNSYTGDTTISGGTLALSGAGDISSGSAALVSIAAGATLDISAAAGARTIGALADGDGSSQVILGDNTLRSVVAGYSMFGGVISGSGGFTKAGGDTLEMTGVQAFTGVATVEAGKLLLASGAGLASASRIQVASGATIETYYEQILTIVVNQILGGYGDISGPLELLASSTLSPGGSVGALNNVGSTTWDAGMHYLFEVNDASGTAGQTAGGWDLFNVTGTLTLAAGSAPENQIVIDLTSLSGTSPGSAANFNAGSVYQWLIADTGQEITTFDPTWFRIDTTNFLNLPGSLDGFSVVRGDQLGFGSNQLYVVYSAIPEPSTFALAGIGLAAASWTAYRRRRRIRRPSIATFRTTLQVIVMYKACAVRRRGFTIVELLVVIAIIGLLVALLLPAVQAARETARIALCLNNLKQISTACLTHVEAQGFFPTGGWDYYWTGEADRGFGATQPAGWAYSVLPYLEQSALHQVGAGLADAARKPLNQQRMLTPVPAFYCVSRRPPALYPAATNEIPSNCDSRPALVSKTDYAANGGDWRGGFAFGPTLACLQTYPSCTGGNVRSSSPNDWLGDDDMANSTGVVTRRSEFTPQDFSDGTSMTLLVAEKYLNADRYTSGNNLEAADNNDTFVGQDWDSIRWTYLAPQLDTRGVSNSEQFGSAHPLAIGAASCDGAVRGISYRIDPAVWRRLGNRRDAAQGPASWPDR